MSSSGTYVLWHYSPSLPGAAIVAGIFAVATFAHLFLRFRRHLKYTNCFIAGGLFEAIGYAFRGYAHYHQTSITPYAIQSLLILLGPILFAASVYMFLSRVLRASGHVHLSPLPDRHIAKVFVLGDVTCFLVQAVGGGVLSAGKTTSTLNIGNDIILAGLVLQIVIFCGFVATIATFHVRYNKVVEKRGQETRKHLMLLYTTSALITIRNIYRVFEFGLGQDGYLIAHEWSLFVFDAAPMIVVICVSIMMHQFQLRDGEHQSMELLRRSQDTV